LAGGVLDANVLERFMNCDGWLKNGDLVWMAPDFGQKWQKKLIRLS